MPLMKNDPKNITPRKTPMVKNSWPGKVMAFPGIYCPSFPHAIPLPVIVTPPIKIERTIANNKYGLVVGF